jgi:hypothetical protein
MPGTEIVTSTINRSYQLPYPTNKQSFDVLRLIAALTAVDADVAALISSLAAKADLLSPAFAGIPTAPTAASSDDSNQLATTAFVQDLLAAFDTTGFAPITDPTFLGNPKAPTRTPGDNTTSIATTAFVEAVRAALVNLAPANLDNFGEVAAALGNDPAFAATTAASIAAAIAQIPDYVDGLTQATNAATPLYYIDIQPGECRFGGKKASLAAVMTKRLNTAWAQGANAGALDTGVFAASKTYNWHVLRKLSDTSIVDFIASLANTSAGVTVPAGWEILARSRLFSTMTSSGAAQISPFSMTGSRIRWETYTTEYASTSFDNNAYNPIGCPDGISVDGDFWMEVGVGSNSAAVHQADTYRNVASAGALTVYVNTVAASRVRVGGRVRTRPDGTMWCKSVINVGSGDASLWCLGYRDYTVPRIGG